MANHLSNETSPYLLQHKDNPVDWYPWGEEAFQKAKEEDKPIFLSVGYSTCHWCHVMAHESFESPEVAKVLNKYFVSIKVDKEERPDIDSIYMKVCMAFTGNGGWPMSIFLTPDQKPFFAGTYLPKQNFISLIMNISIYWTTEREKLLETGKNVLEVLRHQSANKGELMESLIDQGLQTLTETFDSTYGGFGQAPKFPTPHNLLFLMQEYEKTGKGTLLEMAETTLLSMYQGGIFDHIGYGFSRYSTDERFLVPHFEKMLYDNALLISAYSKAYDITGKNIYKEVAEKISDYISREMTSPEGGFYCAQDADSDGVEGGFYVFEPKEITDILEEEVGQAFNEYFDITEVGNFEGKNIPNLLKQNHLTDKFNQYLPKLRDYRKKRASLHLDDKILTSWNGLMIGALAQLYRITGEETALAKAKSAIHFLEENLSDGEELYVSYRNGKHSGKGFLDDYASYIYALLQLYEASLESTYLEKAEQFCQKAIEAFYDWEAGGFFLYGKNHEQLILQPKETYDGAVPSGNSLMAYNLVLLAQITEKKEYETLAKAQLEFMSMYAKNYPAGYSFYLMSLSSYINPAVHIVCVLKTGEIPEKMPTNAVVYVTEANENYPLVNDKTTYYVCRNKTCEAPVNSLRK
jgi:hypothetical protein